MASDGSRLTRRNFLAGALAAGAVAPLAATSPEEGFEPIFNGKDLTGWEGDSLLWVVEDGMLIGRSPGIPYNDFLATEARYGDFILRFDIHLLNNVGNSGAQFRSERVTGSMEMIGYQADVGPTWWGNLYDESRRRVTLVEGDKKVLEKRLKPDDWNAYEVFAQGPKIRLSINGGVTAEYTETESNIPQEGRIAVQIHSGPAIEPRFRNLRIKVL